MVKFKDFSRPSIVFQVLIKANFTFKDFSRQSCIFNVGTLSNDISSRKFKHNIPVRTNAVSTSAYDHLILLLYTSTKRFEASGFTHASLSKIQGLIKDF